MPPAAAAKKDDKKGKKQEEVIEEKPVERPIPKSTDHTSYEIREFLEHYEQPRLITIEIEEEPRKHLYLINSEEERTRRNRRTKTTVLSRKRGILLYSMQIERQEIEAKTNKRQEQIESRPEVTNVLDKYRQRIS